MQPANYFQSLSQPAATANGNQMAPAVAVTTTAAVSAAPVAMAANQQQAAPVNAMVAPAGNLEDNGPFVLPDPPSDHQQERDQVS